MEVNEKVFNATVEIVKAAVSASTPSYAIARNPDAVAALIEQVFETLSRLDEKVPKHQPRVTGV